MRRKRQVERVRREYRVRYCRRYVSAPLNLLNRAFPYLLALSIELDCDKVVEFFGELAVVDLDLQTLLDAFHIVSYLLFK